MKKLGDVTLTIGGMDITLLAFLKKYKEHLTREEIVGLYRLPIGGAIEIMGGITVIRY